MWRALIAASLLAGCATVDRVEQTLGLDDERPPDNALEAIRAANVQRCPAGRTLEGANHEAFGPQHGVTAEEIAAQPLASDPSRVLRMRRLVIEPGGVIAWHAHDTTQGMAMIVSGEATEIRSSCMGMIRYRAGDVAIEEIGMSHGWRNNGDVPAVVLVVHVVARD